MKSCYGKLWDILTTTYANVVHDWHGHYSRYHGMHSGTGHNHALLSYQERRDANLNEERTTSASDLIGVGKYY
uniref:Uncharacterized protein n=1 Tax=Macrostomum lignano TaxID=282301 RepID=A0A1I8JS13_9PLAT